MSFVESFQQSCIFHHPAWMETLSICYGYKPFILVTMDRQGEIEAGIPFMEVYSPLTGRRWVSLPFSDYCQPLSRDDASLERLTAIIASYYHTEKLNKIEIRWCLPELDQFCEASDYVLHTIPLEAGIDCVSRGFKRTHMQNIHTAEERGVQVKLGTDLEHMRIFYQLQLETRQRHGVPAQPWRYFKCLARHVLERGLGFVLLAVKDGEYLAGMVYLHWHKILVAKYAASREDRLSLRPNNLLFWEGMRWGCQNGYEFFNMGKTENENTGLRNFKCRWGAVEQPLYYTSIRAQASKPPSRRIENWMHVVLKRSPIWVTRLSGELLYKHFG